MSRKTTKSEAREAIDNFYWNLAYVTGGTTQESLRQAPEAIKGLEAKAAKVAALMANPGKILAADSHLAEMAANIPARLATYRSRYLSEPAKLAGQFMADCGNAGNPVHPTEQSRVMKHFSDLMPKETPSNVIQFPKSA